MVSQRAKSEDDRLLEELSAVYRETDALYSGSSCASSTECCRFGITGREPYVTSIEVLAIERAVARNGGPLAPKRRALSVTSNPAGERTCPLLAQPGRCSIHADRPFGCRTFYCERATHVAPPSRDAMRELSARVRELAGRHVPGGDAPRPLTRALSGPLPSSRGRPTPAR